MTAKFELDFLEQFKGTEFQVTTKALYRARQAFDSIKMGIGEDDEPEFWDCPVEGVSRYDGECFKDGHVRFLRQAPLTAIMK